MELSGTSMEHQGTNGTNGTSMEHRMVLQVQQVLLERQVLLGQMVLTGIKWTYWTSRYFMVQTELMVRHGTNGIDGAPGAAGGTNGTSLVATWYNMG